MQTPYGAAVLLSRVVPDTHGDSLIKGVTTAVDFLFSVSTDACRLERAPNNAGVYRGRSEVSLLRRQEVSHNPKFTVNTK